MSVVIALAAGLLFASPFARAVPPSSPSMAAPSSSLPAGWTHPLRNRLERRTWASLWRRGLA